MSAHKYRRYSRWVRIRRRLLALAAAPTVAEQLAELRPAGHTLVMASKDARAPLVTASGLTEKEASR